MARKKRKRPSGQGCVYQRGPGNFWIKWRVAGRVCTKGGYPTEDEAKKMLDVLTADARAGRDRMPTKPKPIQPLGELATEWLERREKTHRSAGDDKGRWNLHLAPYLAKLRPDEVDPALLRKIIEAKLAEGKSSSTARLLMRLLSTFYSDLVERWLSAHNPVKMLPRATRRLVRPSHDPRTTPFVERLEDVRRIYLALPDPVNLAYAIGALAGLRTGEILALRWDHVDLDRRRIHVRESVGGPLKDDDSRMVPIQDALHPLLSEWHLRTGGQGQVVPPMRGGTRRRCDEHTLGKKLRDALDTLATAKVVLPKLTWYQATRHTFASQWVIAGGSIEKLKEVMGHSTVLVTERYAHLRADLFSAADLGRVVVDLTAATGKIIPLAGGKASDSGTVGYAVVTGTNGQADKAVITS